MTIKAPIPLRSGRWDAAIARLDAERDAPEIVRILVNHVFPLENLVALEIAQLRTFTIPSISKTLHATRQYEDHGVKRLDDTRAILAEIVRPGLGTPASEEVVAHLNRIHGLYDISNDDYLYTLSTFVFDPVFFIERFGYREFTRHEKTAIHSFNRRLGELLGVRDIPPSYEAFLSWRVAYEARAQRYAPENEAVARGLLAAAAKIVAPPFRPFMESFVVLSAGDEAFRKALGLRVPDRWLSRVLPVAVRAHKHFSRRFNPFEESPFWDTQFFKTFSTYPNGYDRLRLGPAKVIALFDKLNRAARSKP